MSSSGQGIGLLGGSFDPVHNGHLAIAQSFLASGLISELWILLTPDPPHKQDKTLNHYDERLAMLRAAFQTINGVTVSDIENNLPKPSYTIQTLQHLRAEHPSKKFCLCLGEDSVASFTQWKDWKQILDYCELLVAHRPGEESPELDPEISSKTHIVDHQPVDVSSTRVRALVKEGQDISSLVPEAVQEFIKKNNLYQDT